MEDIDELKEEKIMNVTSTEFQNYRLRRIIKENHGEKINVLTMGLKPIHENELDLSHLILTVGDKQVNIYDNQNHRDNLDLMCHFKLNEDDFDSQGTFYSGCWLRKSKDSLIAFAGDSGIIHVISLAYSQEIFRLSGHTGRVIQLIPHPIYEHLLLSVSEDHTIRVWNLELKSTVAIINVDATVACFNPKGNKIITGLSTGEIKFIKLPIMLFNQNNNVRLSITKSIPLLKQSLHGDKIDQLVMINDKTIISKSINGIIIYWECKTQDIKWRLCFKDYKFNIQTKLAVSEDKNYFLIGGYSGTIYVYDLILGKKIFDDKHRRSTKPIYSCTFAKKDRNLLFTSGDGLIWRYDYINDNVLLNWDNWKNGIDVGN